jgi:NAD(P)-dependent dehydrogenase (short-subunit alcohol dehydrogenase family)
MNLNLKSAFLCSKAGVAVLTSAIAEEFKKSSITANYIVPSTIDTPENRALIFPPRTLRDWEGLNSISGSERPIGHGARDMEI